MSAGVTTTAERNRAVEHWLAAAAPDPREVRAEWDLRGVALLPTGVLFSAVRIHAATVHAAAGTTAPEEIDRYLASALDGPVLGLADGASYVALLPVSSARKWDLPGTPCLGRGAFVGVPRPGSLREHGERAFWAVPMESAGVLCDPAEVFQLALLGQSREADRG